MHRDPEAVHRVVVRAAEVHPVREQGDRQVPRGIDPQRGAGESGVAERAQRKQIAAISTGMGSLQALGSTIGFGIAYQYRTSKAALNMTMSILAKEVEPRGISVVIFSPGWVQTDMGGANAALTPEQSIGGMRKVLEGNPMELTGKFVGYDGATWPW